MKLGVKNKAALIRKMLLKDKRRRKRLLWCQTSDLRDQTHCRCRELKPVEVRGLKVGITTKSEEQWSATKESFCLFCVWWGSLYRAKILLLIPALVVRWLVWTLSFTQSRITRERSIRRGLSRLCSVCLQEGCLGYSNQCGKTHLHCGCGRSQDQGSWVT